MHRWIIGGAVWNRLSPTPPVPSAGEATAGYVSPREGQSARLRGYMGLTASPGPAPLPSGCLETPGARRAGWLPERLWLPGRVRWQEVKAGVCLHPWSRCR